jgi:hypothetical protein
MNIRKEQTMDMYIEKIVLYSTYVDCLARVIRELIENGDDNFKPTDLPNLTVLLSKLACRLRYSVSGMNRDWEFLD